jgi:hypothetical protein
VDSQPTDACDLVVVEFTDPTAVLAGFGKLAELVDAGRIRLRDLEFIHSIDGIASTVPAGRVDHELARFEGALAGLLDRDILDAVASEMPHRNTAAALLCDGEGIADVIMAWTSGGARVTHPRSSSG